MKKMLYIFLLIATASVLSSCSNDSTSPETTSPETPSSEILSSETTSPENETAGSSDEVGSGDDARFISVQTENGSIIYQLNDSAAASLYQQLPRTVESEDFSTNEKIFYPPQELNTDNCPLAAGGSGTLAYYQPWGDVVMFYGNYSENPSLFELGHVISGEELISRLSGTITIDIYQ